MTEHSTSTSTPASLGIIAGRGAYPLLLAESARRQGVRNIFVVAFKGETDRSIAKYADEVAWLYVGQLGRLLDALRESGVREAVMAGQIRPMHLFHTRPDVRMLELLRGLKQRNADTIFGAVGRELNTIGIALQPAHIFMISAMPEAGTLTRRAPDEREWNDIRLGMEAAKATSAMNIGQTVVVKEGTILAVEAFEGTNEAIERAGRLGGPGAVVVKAARQGHDMRFDIPVIGLHTVKVLKKIRASALAVEAGRTIILERDEVVQAADKSNLALVAIAADGD